MATQGNQLGPGGRSPLQRVLIISEMPYQALTLQRLFAELGSEATLAVGEEAGLVSLSLRYYDAVVIDVDMGYRVVGDLMQRLRRDHPGSEVAIMVGWWDERAVEMRSYSDVLICKPAHPQQLRDALGHRLAAPFLV